MVEAVIGFCGVVLGVFLTGAKDWLSDFRVRSRDARYLAIRVVCALDQYVDGCVGVVGDDGLYHGQRDQDGCRDIQVSLPDAPSFPKDIDWKSIPQGLMYQTLRFPNEIEAANRQIGGVWDMLAFPPDYEEGFEERQFQYASLGLSASNLANDFRKKYGIHDREHHGWDPEEYLISEKNKIENARHKRRSN